MVECVENPAMPVRLRLLWIDSHFTAHHSLVRWVCNTLFTRLNDNVQSSLKYSHKSIFASLCSSNAVVCLLTRFAVYQNEYVGSSQIKRFFFFLFGETHFAFWITIVLGQKHTCCYCCKQQQQQKPVCCYYNNLHYIKSEISPDSNFIAQCTFMCNHNFCNGKSAAMSHTSPASLKPEFANCSKFKSTWSNSGWGYLLSL